MTSILITGANRGLGLEFVRQCNAAGWRVLACCREPVQADELQKIAADSEERVSLHRLDVGDLKQIEALGRDLRDESIDILLNNAGIYGPKDSTFGHSDYRAWAEVLAVNVLAPMRMAECFIEQVASSNRKLIIGMSSQMGSIGDNSYGQHYPYRSSKAALNMLTRSAGEWYQKRGIILVTISPGWTRTEMGGPKATNSPEESVKGVRNVIVGLTMADTGKFFNFNGQILPW